MYIAPTAAITVLLYRVLFINSNVLKALTTFGLMRVMMERCERCGFMNDMEFKVIMEQCERIGTQIRTDRKTKGLSLVQVEMQTGITIARLCQLERGLLKGLYVYELMLIAKALGLNASLLMEGISTGECDEPTIKELAHRKRVLDFDWEEYKKKMGEVKETIVTNLIIRPHIGLIDREMCGNEWGGSMGAYFDFSSEEDLNQFLDMVHFSNCEEQGCDGVCEVSMQPVHISIIDKTIDFEELPLLKCKKCGRLYITVYAANKIRCIYEQLKNRSDSGVFCKRTQYLQRYNYCEDINFEYDSRDYRSIPRLCTLFSNDGFLQPVFFDLKALIAFIGNQDYDVDRFSEPYGNLA